jgi:hypothetical protein
MMIVHDREDGEASFISSLFSVIVQFERESKNIRKKEEPKKRTPPVPCFVCVVEAIVNNRYILHSMLLKYTTIRIHHLLIE